MPIPKPPPGPIGPPILVDPDWTELIAANPTLSDAELATQMNSETQDADVASVSGGTIFEATTAVDFAALTDPQKTLWLAICQMQDVRINDANTTDQLNTLFAAGTDTAAAIDALRVTQVPKYPPISALHGPTRKGGTVTWLHKT